MKRLQIVLLLVIALAVSGMIYSASGSLSRYASFEDARASDADFHVVGQWVRREAAHYDPQHDVFEFYMQDTTQEVSLVRYPEPKPVNFEQAKKVVVIGRHQGDHFAAKKILMKCPSKYKENRLAQPDKQASLRQEP